MKKTPSLLNGPSNKLRALKTLNSKVCILALLFFSLFASSQEYMKPQKLGELQTIVKSIVEANPKAEAEYQYGMTVSNEMSFVIDVRSDTSTNYKYYMFGTVEGLENATFFLGGDDNDLNGRLLDYENKVAYLLYTNADKEVYIEEVDINKQVCIMDGWLTASTEESDRKEGEASTSTNRLIPQLESFPGAEGVIYIDFDGENVSGGTWGTINATASDYNDTEIEKVWYIMAEDFAPFQINVTTVRSVYENANVNMRQMVIFNETYPSGGGVASFNTYNNGSNDPCWVNTTGIINSVWLGGNVGSHEVGHTLGLYHDGDSQEEYWLGHGDFNVIMGRCNRVIAQWSKGEYQGANNTQDDLNIIDQYNTPYRVDDHGNNMGSSSNLVFDESTGTVSEDDNFGIIETRNDKDYFKLELIDGDLELNFRPADAYLQSPNLDIQARLLNASGNEVFVSNPDDSMGAIIEQTVTAGVYYVEIDGVGFGDPVSSGYSDYASLGQYFISGVVPFNNMSAPVASFSSDETTGCGSLTVTFTDQSAFSPTSWSWDFGDGSPLSTDENPTHTYASIGNYTVTLTATNQYGNNTETKVDYISVLEGEEYAPVSVGLENNNVSAEGGFYATPQGLIFTVKEELDLISVKVYADGAGNRTFALEDSAGSVLETLTVNLTDGEQRVTLNWDAIPVGSDYVIKATSVGNGLYRDKGTGITFPIVDDLIDITCNTYDEPTCGSYYYFFYDWEVRELGCDASLGVDDNTFLSGIVISPNPANDVLNINLEQKATGKYDVLMYNMLGAIVKKASISHASTESTMDISAISSGVYIVKVVNEQNNLAIFKIVKE